MAGSVLPPIRHAALLRGAGPDAARAVDAAQAADRAACKALLRDGSRTFLAASMLLPPSVRDPACALYAFCRLADDAVDAPGRSAEFALQSLRRRLAAVYAGRPLDFAADRALARVVTQFEVPRGLLEALLEGFAWDHDGRRYETLDDLLAYAARVAGTVGAIMALLMNTRSAQAVARACELGCAMQLSNIARDVGEDARMGRVYLPTHWLREAGVDVDAWLERPVFTPEIAQVTERLLQAADVLYERVGAGIALLPLSCRPGINAARLLYADIGQQVRRNGLDSVSRRAVVPRRRKLVLLLQAGGRLPRAVEPEQAPAPIPATLFLLDMLTPEPSRRAAFAGRAPALATQALATQPPTAPSHSGAARILEMFERQEHRRIERRSLASVETSSPSPQATPSR